MFDLAAATVSAAQPQPSGSLPFDVTQILQFGLLGIIFLCLVFRKWIVPEWTLKQQEDRAQSERDELAERLTETRDQLNKLQEVFQDQMIPALTRATEINARYTEELQKQRYAKRKSSASDPDD